MCCHNESILSHMSCSLMIWRILAWYFEVGSHFLDFSENLKLRPECSLKTKKESRTFFCIWKTANIPNMIWGRSTLDCAFFTDGVALYGYHHCFWTSLFRNNVPLAFVWCGIKHPAVGHCGGNSSATVLLLGERFLSRQWSWICL